MYLNDGSVWLNHPFFSSFVPSTVLERRGSQPSRETNFKYKADDAIDGDNETLSEKPPAKNIIKVASRATFELIGAQFPQIIKEMALARSGWREEIML